MANSQKHILVLSSWFPTEQSPFLGNFVIRQIELLSKSYQVSVINCEASSKVRKTTIDIDERGSIRQIHALFPKKKTLIQRKLKQKRAFELAMEKVDQVDFIIGNVLLPNGWQFILAKRKFKCPLFYIEHGSYFHPDNYNWRRIDHIIRKKVNDIADEIIAVSSFQKKDLEGFFPGKNIKVIGNHIDTSLFSFKEKTNETPTEFLHISTLDERTKNPLGILKAASLLKEKGSDFKLTIISDEDYSKWRAVSVELGLSEHVYFDGPKKWQELVPYYQRSSAFILFSSYESFSIVVGEAWSTGTPVIATAVGIASNVNNTLGIQVQQGDVHELANAMQLIVDGKKFDGKVIRKHALDFSEERITNEWSKLIEVYG